MKKSVKSHYLGPIILVLFLFSFISPVFASQAVTNQTNYYIDKYFEIDKDGHWRMNIYLGDQILATIDDTGATTFPLTDHLGSPTIITNQSGNIVETNEYDAFGNVIYSTSTIKNVDKFNGKKLDTETNLQYYGARYYDQNLGRWLSPDPQTIYSGFDLADPQTLNTYAYVTNNPLRYIDQNGETRADYRAPNYQPTVGQPSGTYRGVQLYAGKGAGQPHESQCVVGVQNLYKQLFDFNLTYGLGPAVNYADLGEISKGKIAHYAQGATVMPQENDIITWSGGANGHIGMIIETDYDSNTHTGMIYTVEQNRSLKRDQFQYHLSGTIDSNGATHYYINDDSKSLKIISWQRPADGRTNPNANDTQPTNTRQQSSYNWLNKFWNSIKSFFAGQH